MPVVAQVTTPHTVSAPAPAQGRQPFAQQLNAPVLRLAAGAAGEHVLTVRVAPEHLGPVTVQAHIDANGVRIELFSPTEAGRAAVHAALPELRRDLASAGMGASLDLSHRDAPAAQTSSGNDPGSPGNPAHPGDTGGQRGSGRTADLPSRPAAGPRSEASPLHPQNPSSYLAVLDVLA